jgi:predicted DNA-binding protein (MmcQ/YjbR family)
LTDFKALRDYCNQKPGAVEDYPFDETTLVFKVEGKMFALMPLDRRDEPPSINLKCDPTLAEMLRTIYDAVKPGYHMDKRHWNTVIVDGSIPMPEIYEMIDNSYDLVVKGLPKNTREKLAQRNKPPKTSPKRKK